MSTSRSNSVDLLHTDCMDYMAGCEDNAFDLAIVDPPYGINAGNTKGLGRGKKNQRFISTEYKKKSWDEVRPDKAYFDELQRVAKNYIVWGANYFSDMLPPSNGVVFWDKMIGDNDFSAGELAYTSYSHSLKKVAMYHGGNRHSHCAAVAKLNARIHPTQKPIKLYTWLLETYATPGQRILDTHLGSGSSAIAAHYFGCDFVGMEIDADYYAAAVERYANETRQAAMF